MNRHDRHDRHFKENQQLSHDDIEINTVMEKSNTVMDDDIPSHHDDIEKNTVIRKPQYSCASDGNDGNDDIFPTPADKKGSSESNLVGGHGGTQKEEGSPSSTPRPEEKGSRGTWYL